MARILKNKGLENTKLATTYGGWIYCTKCNQNIGYLCYVTYDKFILNYTCHCGSNGRVLLEFEDSIQGIPSSQDLITLKNKFCCPDDESPLVTILAKKVEKYEFEITCKECGKSYTKSSN